MSPRIWFWRHEPCLLVLPFGTTTRNLHLVDLECSQALAWQLEDTLPHSSTRFASYWLILLQSQMEWVGKHELVPSCAFRACNIIVCSSGVHSLPFFAPAISRVSLNSGLSREHMYCHMFLPARGFPSGLGNIPVTEIGGSPFPHRGVILDVGGFPKGSVVCDPTACNDDASIIGICSSANTDVLASFRKKFP